MLLILGCVGVAALLLSLFLAPAKTTILIDTPTSTARADMRLLWGIGPSIMKRYLPRRSTGTPLATFHDAARMGYALLTPGLADVTIGAVRRVFALKPRVAHVALGVNTGDYAKDLVVQTAVQAALTISPAAVRDAVTFSKCETPGAEIDAKFELYASPLQISSIWDQLRSSKPVREFTRRLRRKPKPVKKPVREVQAS